MTFDEFVEQEALLAAAGKNPDIVVLRFAELHARESAGHKQEMPGARSRLTPPEAAQYAVLHAIMRSRWRWKYASDEARQKR